MRKRMRHRRKRPHLPREPRRHRVPRRARPGPRVIHKLGRPQVRAGAEGFGELEGRVRRGVVLDAVGGRANARGGGGVGRGLLDVAVAVVADFDEVGGARGEAGVEGGLPGFVGGEVGGADAEVLVGGEVEGGLEVHVVDLGVQEGLAAAEDCGGGGVSGEWGSGWGRSTQAAGHPVDVGVLQVV